MERRCGGDLSSPGVPNGLMCRGGSSLPHVTVGPWWEAAQCKRPFGESLLIQNFGSGGIGATAAASQSLAKL